MHADRLFSLTAIWWFSSTVVLSLTTTAICWIILVTVRLFSLIVDASNLHTGRLFSLLAVHSYRLIVVCLFSSAVVSLISFATVYLSNLTVTRFFRPTTNWSFVELQSCSLFYFACRALVQLGGCLLDQLCSRSLAQLSSCCVRSACQRIVCSTSLF